MANNNLEKEIRFFYPTSKLENLHDMLRGTGANFLGRYYQLTIMYDNPNQEFSFYKPEIDGRLRFRTSIFTPLPGQPDVEGSKSSSKITWKRRLPKEVDSGIHNEEEIEVDVDYENYKNMEEILENVLKCKRMSSYERYRNIYKKDGLSITIDEFPYGVMLEVELEDAVEEDLMKFIEELGLLPENAYNLSCDDKYVELCEEVGCEVKDDILFVDKDMPQIK